MSNGAIIDLVAKGDMDKDIIDIENKSSFFEYNIIKKNKYSKGDFIFYSEGNINWGNTIRFNIEKKGDLLYGLYIKIKLPKLSISELNVTPKPNEYDVNSKYRVKYTDFIGNALIEKVSLYINGQLIDELYGDYMQIYTDLYLSDWNRKAMIGLDDCLNKPNLKIDSEIIYIPLKFWFCNDIKKPLPVIALQYSDIYIDVKFRDFNQCICVLEYDNSVLFHSNVKHNEPKIEDISLQANFYFLDLEERKKMAMDNYEILITQSQFRSIDLSTSANLDINFNHVIKDLMFFIQSDKNKNNGEYFNLSSKPVYLPNELIGKIDNTKLWELEPKRHLLSKARILFDGMERLEWRDAKYFYNMQNHENYKNMLYSYAYVYSFNVGPTLNISYTGCNFSRIDNPQLQVVTKTNPFVVNKSPEIRCPIDDTYHLKCYATNYNILVIKNGLVGIKYIN